MILKEAELTPAAAGNSEAQIESHVVCTTEDGHSPREDKACCPTANEPELRAEGGGEVLLTEWPAMERHRRETSGCVLGTKAEMTSVVGEEI